MPGESGYIWRTQDFLCFMGNRRCKPVGLVSPSLQATVCALRSPCGKQAPGLLLTKGLDSWVCSATVLPSVSPCLASRTQNSFCLKSWCPMPVLAALVSGSCTSKQTQGSCCPRLVLPWLQQLMKFLEAHTWQADPRAPADWRLGSPMPVAAALGPVSFRAISAHKLCSPMTAATPVAPGSLHLANRPQDSGSLKTWIPYPCSSCHGSWKSMSQHN
jgi:hypothetical protein